MKKACLIFPLLFRDRDYDECAHGWLDGLNRLFMEAKLSLLSFATEADLCRCFSAFITGFPENFLHVSVCVCSPNGKWSQEVNPRFSSLISNNDATQNFCVSFPIHPSSETPN